MSAAEMAWLLPLHWCNASTACVREMVQDRPTRRAFAPGALLVSYSPLAWLGRRAADFEDSLTLLRLDALTHTVYTVEVASAIPASA